MSRPSIRRILILCAAGVTIPSILSAAEQRPPSDLKGVEGLARPVSYTETKIPLGELVQKVAADTGVTLTTAPDVADEPVAVVVKELPAHALLEELADLLDYRWSRRPAKEGVKGRGGEGVTQAPNSALNTQRSAPSYEISQDLASRQREEALRQALYAGAEQRLREELTLCREIARKSQEEMRRLWDEATHWNERLDRMPPEERQALLRSPEGQRQSLRHAMARRLWDPIQRSLALLITRLPPEQWAALRNGRQLVLSSDPQPGKLPLEPEVLRVFRTSRPSVSPAGQPHSARPEHEEIMRRYEREIQERWDQAEQYDVILRLLAFESCWWDLGGISFEAISQPFRGGQRLGRQDANPSLYLGPHGTEAFPPVAEDPGRRTRLEQDAVLSIKKPFQPDTRPYRDPLLPGASRTSRLLPEILPELAHAYGVHIIADSYWGGGWNALFVSSLSSLTGPRPLFEVLDGLVARVDDYAGRGVPFVWDRRGSLIRIRSRTWFLDRPREIPLRHIRRCLEWVDRRGALPLEEYTTLATTLTGLQLDTVDLLFQRGILPQQLNDLRSLSGSLSLLRLYARLSPAQRQALQTGQPLAMAQLSPALRPFVLAHLQRAHRGRIPQPHVEQWIDGHLTLTRKPDVRIREQRGRSVTWRLASEPAPRAVTPPDAVTRFPVTRLRMEVRYRGQAPTAVGLIVAADAGASAQP